MADTSSAPSAPSVTADEVEHLVLMATRAPSVHNTQPWRFSRITGGLLVGQDRTRQLSVIDPDGRELLLSCGAAIHHLTVAARALGIDTEVALLAPGKERDAIARIGLTHGAAATHAEVATAVAILHRHTHRGRFSDEPLQGNALDQLRVAVEREHAMLRVVRDDELVEVEVLVSRAEHALQQTPGYSKELARWVWHGDEEDRSDGLPLEAVDHGTDRAESLEGRQFSGHAAARPDEPPAAEHPIVVLLSTPADTPDDWLQGGRALSALLLRATELGVVAQPMGQVMDIPASRQALAELLGIVGAPQMVLRLGRGTSTPASPRRPLEDFLPA